MVTHVCYVGPPLALFVPRTDPWKHLNDTNVFPKSSLRIYVPFCFLHIPKRVVFLGESKDCLYCRILRPLSAHIIYKIVFSAPCLTFHNITISIQRKMRLSFSQNLLFGHLPRFQPFLFVIPFAHNGSFGGAWQRRRSISHNAPCWCGCIITTSPGS